MNVGDGFLLSGEWAGIRVWNWRTGEGNKVVASSLFDLSALFPDNHARMRRIPCTTCDTQGVSSTDICGWVSNAPACEPGRRDGGKLHPTSTVDGIERFHVSLV